MKNPSIPAILCLAIALGSRLDAAEAPVPGATAFTTVISNVPAGEVGIPEEIRTDGREFFVVPVQAKGAFWIFDAESGERRKVVVHPPAAFSELSVRCVDRLAKKRLVASASWVEEGVSRSGLLFMDDDGTVQRYSGFGFSVRSIVVGPTKEWIVGSVQEPIDPKSNDLHQPTANTIAEFTPSGKLLGMQSMNVGNVMKTFDEMLRTHRYRKVFVMRDSVLLTYPFRTSRVPFPSAYVLPGWAVETEGLRKSAIPRDYSRSWVPVQPPKGESPNLAGLRVLAIVPQVVEGKSGLLAAWLTTTGEDGKRDTPHRDRGKLFLARYDVEGGRPTSWQEVDDGTRVGELTAAPDGRAFAITYTQMAKEWSISRIDF